MINEIFAQLAVQAKAGSTIRLNLKVGTLHVSNGDCTFEQQLGIPTKVE
jgi:hypothetical protein